MKCLVLLVVLQMLTIAYATLEFDCRRQRQDCLNAGTCTVNGTCLCLDGFSNYICDHEDDKGGTNCSSECPDPDKCTPDDLECRCRSFEYGPLCQYKRFQLVCAESGKIVINANVIGADVAYVYNETTCPLNDTTSSEIPSGWEGPIRVINTPSDTDCGDADPTDNEDGTTRYCVTAYIRYRDDYWTGLDTTVTYCCSGTEVDGITVSNIDVGDGLPGTTLPPEVTDSSDIRATFYYSNGTEIIDSANIGDMVVLRMRLAPSAVSVGLKPLECSLKGDPESADGVELVTDWCPTANLNSDLIYNEAGSWDLEFEMVKFVGSDSVYVVCDVRLCIDEDNCDDELDFCGPLRKKREAERNSSSDELQHIVAKVGVEDPFLDSRVEGNEALDTRRTTINLSAAVIGLAVVVLLLLVACFILTMCLMKRRSTPALKA